MTMLVRVDLELSFVGTSGLSGGEDITYLTSLLNSEVPTMFLARTLKV